MSALVDLGSASAATIQQALAQRGRVQLSAGKVVIDQTLKVSNGTSLEGVGRGGSVLQRAPGFRGNLIEVPFNAAYTKDVAISGLTLDDTFPEDQVGTTSVFGMPLSLMWLDGGEITDVEIKNGTRHGIQATACRNLLFQGCRVDEVRGVRLKSSADDGGHGLVLYSEASKADGYPWCEHITISQCTFRRGYRTGTLIRGARHVKVEACTYEDNAPTDELIDTGGVPQGVERGGQLAAQAYSYGLTFRGNHLLGGNATQGIEINVAVNEPYAGPCSDILIDGNWISNQGYSGVLLWAPDGAQLAGRQAQIVVRGNVLKNNNRRRNYFYGSIHAVGGIYGFTLDGNQIEDDSGNRGIRTRNTGGASSIEYVSGDYTIVNSRLNLKNLGSVSASSVIDHRCDVASRCTVRENQGLVNGSAWFLI